MTRLWEKEYGTNLKHITIATEMTTTRKETRERISSFQHGIKESDTAPWATTEKSKREKEPHEKNTRKRKTPPKISQQHHWLQTLNHSEPTYTEPQWTYICGTHALWDNTTFTPSINRLRTTYVQHGSWITETYESSGSACVWYMCSACGGWTWSRDDSSLGTWLHDTDTRCRHRTDLEELGNINGQWGRNARQLEVIFADE